MISVPFKEFEEITEDDYHKIGFRAGIEIHQQLDTKYKLFCRCSSPQPPYDDSYQFEIYRTLRPALSELGEIDPSIMMEYKSKKEIIYRINRESVCLYELDQSPPFEINQYALDIVISYCLKFRARIVDEIYICRKYHLDGSIPSGYQRTAMVGIDGEYCLKGKKIRLPEITIEEDAAREIFDSFHQRAYYLDRLGVPLIEIVTEPAFNSPTELKEFAEAIRNEFLVAGNVRQGSGTLRMDLNISIDGSHRCEIKGVDKISRIPILAYNETRRQWSLLRLRDELHSRNITPENFKYEVYELSSILKHTSFYPIQKALGNGGMVYCIKLPNWGGLLKWPTQRYVSFSQEISERVRVIACLTDTPNIIVSDIIDNTISQQEIDKTKKFIGVSKYDGFVIVWGSPDDVQTAIEEIKIRAFEATVGVPAESRRALPSGATGFERILPGSQRMYPDTDLPYITISKDRVAGLSLLPKENYSERVRWCVQVGFPKNLVHRIATSSRFYLIRELVDKHQISANLLARVFIEFFSSLKKKNYKTKNLSNDRLKEILLMYKNGEIIRDGIFKAIEYALKGKWNEIPTNLAPASGEELERAYNKSLELFTSKKIYHPEKKKEILIGFMMEQLRGRVEGSEVVKFIETKLNEE